RDVDSNRRGNVVIAAGKTSDGRTEDSEHCEGHQALVIVSTPAPKDGEEYEDNKDQNDGKKLKTEQEGATRRVGIHVHGSPCQSNRDGGGENGDNASEENTGKAEFLVQSDAPGGGQPDLSDEKGVPESHHKAVNMHKQREGLAMEEAFEIVRSGKANE